MGEVRETPEGVIVNLEAGVEIADGAFDKSIGKVVPVTDRNNYPEPRQLGEATVLDGNGNVSVQLFSGSHSLQPRGELSLNEWDVYCTVCLGCSCHKINQLFSPCLGKVNH